MKGPAVAVIIVAIIAVVALAIYVSGVDKSPYYETETQFGSWGEEIIIEYLDGTQDSLKLLEMSAPPGELTYNDKPINTVSYRLRAKATGTGYTEANIKFTNLDVELKIYKLTSVKWSDVVHVGTSVHGVPLDNQYHSLSAKVGANFGDIFEDYGWPAGEYKLKFTPATSTDPIYWGTPGQTESDGVSVNLPSGKYMTIQWSPEGTLTVVLGAEFET